MNCYTLVCAQTVIMDKTNNQASLINIYEGIQSANFPFIFPLTVFMSFEREAGEPDTYQLNISIELEDQELYRVPISVAFIGSTFKINMSINFQGVVIGKPGRLLVTVWQEQTALKRAYITIENRK